MNAGRRRCKNQIDEALTVSMPSPASRVAPPRRIRRSARPGRGQGFRPSAEHSGTRAFPTGAEEVGFLAGPTGRAWGREPGTGDGVTTDARFRCPRRQARSTGGAVIARCAGDFCGPFGVGGDQPSSPEPDQRREAVDAVIPAMDEIGMEPQGREAAMGDGAGA